MLERDKFRFMDTQALRESAGIRDRATEKMLSSLLTLRFPDKTIEGCPFHLDSVTVNDTGNYKKVKNLPPFVDVRISVQCGSASRAEQITVWSPLAWNGRFAGTAGGGCSTGGEQYLTPPMDTTRGWTLPYALCNGFTAATADGGNIKGFSDYIINPQTGLFDEDLYENWRARATHHMCVMGKAVAEALHERPVQWAYMNGGSGGGRQSVTAAQEYPCDFDGIWAACPAINWNRFLMVGLWMIAVMNDRHHVISPKHMMALTQAARDAVGGDQAYFHLEQQPYFDPFSAVGKNGISRQDAEVAELFWDGPKTEDGQRLWYSFRPGVKFWTTGIPIGAYWYSIITHKPRINILCPIYYRWITKGTKDNCRDATLDDFYKLFEQSTTKLSSAGCDKPDLSRFAAHGKLMIDHGLNDPLIPVDGTIDYYKRMQETMGSQAVNDFCRLYINPGDGHGSCQSDGPGITESAGMTALMDWVEKGVAPDKLRAVRVHPRSGELLEETKRSPVTDIHDWEVVK